MDMSKKGPSVGELIKDMKALRRKSLIPKQHSTTFLHDDDTKKMKEIEETYFRGRIKYANRIGEYYTGDQDAMYGPINRYVQY